MYCILYCKYCKLLGMLPTQYLKLFDLERYIMRQMINEKLSGLRIDLRMVLSSDLLDNVISYLYVVDIKTSHAMQCTVVSILTHTGSNHKFALRQNPGTRSYTIITTTANNRICVAGLTEAITTMLQWLDRVLIRTMRTPAERKITYQNNCLWW